MKYNIEVHFENQAVLQFVVDLEEPVAGWISRCLDKQYFMCRDDNSKKFIVCNSKLVTGILIKEYSEVEDDQRTCLDDYRTHKPS